MDDLDKIWAEVEYNETGDDVAHYCGLISYLDYEDIYEGKYKKPFLKIHNTFYLKWPSGDDQWQGKKLIEYGKGEHTEYQGETLVRVSAIVAIERMNHGPGGFEDKNGDFIRV